MKLTQEEKRIKIAEACGWKGISAQYLTGYAPWRPLPYEQRVRECPADNLASIPLDPLPDYFNDLNAMHEAEKKLEDEKWDFLTHLTKVLMGYEGVTDWDRAHATAAQRAEAFGRTLNLWEAGA